MVAIAIGFQKLAVQVSLQTVVDRGADISVIKQKMVSANSNRSQGRGTAIKSGPTQRHYNIKFILSTK